MAYSLGSENSRHYDFIVIGAGPAGLIAAGRAASLGSKVLVLEKNRDPGRKLLITGGGRCNLTNAQFDIHTLVNRYGREGRRLYSVFTGFGPRETMDFFQDLNVPLVTEAEDRVFPRDYKATSIRDSLVGFCQSHGVEIRGSTPVRKLDKIKNPGFMGFAITSSKGEVFTTTRVLVATGGFARPETGSTGDGFGWLESMGHAILRPEPILVPIKIRESWISNLMGLSFQDCGLSLFNPEGTRVYRDRGKVLFTHFGLSGPLILNYSSKIEDLASQWRQARSSGKNTTRVPLETAGDKGSILGSPPGNKGNGEKKGFPIVHTPLVLYLDFFPTLDGGAVDRQIAGICLVSPKKRIQTLLAEILPPRLVQQILLLTNIPAENPGGQLTKDQRKTLVSIMKDFPLTYAGKLGNEKAIVSRGGVKLDELDFKTMESKLVPGLLIAGDMIDIDRPSGGFSLQICWSTGWRAGETAAG